jgi:hypothetical protein
MHIILHIILHILHIIMDASYCAYCAYCTTHIVHIMHILDGKSNSQGFHSLLPLLLGPPTQGPAVHIPPDENLQVVQLQESCLASKKRLSTSLSTHKWLSAAHFHATPLFYQIRRLDGNDSRFP